MKILTIVGARPQLVKAAVVSMALRGRGGVHELLLHTGQHYDDSMSDIFFRELGLPTPDFHLGVGSGSHGEQTGRMLGGIEAVLAAERPAAVLVYGDTNSTLAGALAASKLRIPVAHVEAGMRSFNRHMPEEINRVVTDHLSDILFAPTETARNNMLNEGLGGRRIEVVGDVMHDAVLAFSARASVDLPIAPEISAGPYVLATVHRAENTDDPDRLTVIMAALGEVSRRLPVILPLHPRTRAALERAGVNPFAGYPDFRPVSPQGYLTMLALERRAALVVTDSGGVQKEAFFCRVPCVTLRAETEWVELVSAGWNRLAPPVDKESIVDAVAGALEQSPPNADGLAEIVFGGGEAAVRIAELLENFAE